MTVVLISLCFFFGILSIFSFVKWKLSLAAFEEEKEKNSRHGSHSLTGISTFEAFKEQNEGLLPPDSSSVFGLISCEIDNLTLLRDAFGTSVADQVLLQVCQRLESSLRGEDIFGHFSDNELLISCRGLPTQRDVSRFVKRLEGALSDSLPIAGRNHTLHCSFGLAFFTEDSSITNLVDNALLSKSRAKENSARNLEIYDPVFRDEVLDHVEMEQDLRHAIDNKSLEVHFQPVVNTNDSSTSSYEALLRWFHPVKGLLRPDVYLPIAEQSNLIIEISDFVVAEACSQAARISDSFERIDISVNISERQLASTDFEQKLQKNIAHNGLEPSQLQIEISERILTQNPEKFYKKLERVASTGVSIAIDDFGASQASVGMLKDLPMVSTLKVDRLFVENIGDNRADYDLARAVTSLANSLGMRVVAEGVERADHAQILKEIGITSMQGFLYQRPASFAELFKETEKVVPA